MTEPQAETTRVKGESLRKFFPPEQVGWTHKPADLKEGNAAPCYPFIAAYAIRDRLDEVLGADNWRERFDNPGEYTRCVLEVRFYAGGDWVTRVGLSNTKELDRAHAESLREAAKSLGIGRYLTPYVDHVVWKGGAFERTAKLPNAALPVDYQTCGREMGGRMRDMLRQCCEESKKRGRVIYAKEAAKGVTRTYNYPVDKDGNVNLSLVQNRHATGIMAKLNNWLAELAADKVAGASCPVESKPVENKSEEKPAPPPTTQTPQAQGDTSPAPVTDQKTGDQIPF